MRSRGHPPSDEDLATIARELLKLDPWAFWTVRLEHADAPFAVLGRTGAFVVGVSPLEGYLVEERGRLRVEGRPVRGRRRLRAAARRLEGRLTAAGAARTDVTSLLVLTRAAAGAPRDHRGVRVVRPSDLVGEITRRDHRLDPSTAKRLAERIGPVLRGPAAPGIDG